MKNKYFYLGLIFIGIITGCATSGNYQHVVNNWQGKNIKELQKAWGTPDTTAQLPNGNTLYVYKREQLYTTSPIYPATSTNFVQVDGKNRYIASYDEAVQGQTTSRYCRTWFEANSKGIIVQAQFQGSGCVAGSFSGITP